MFFLNSVWFFNFADMKQVTLISAATLATFGALGQKPAAKPNIILILTDQQRFDCLGAVNNVVITPNLDSLAASGVLFTNGYTPSPSSTPARSALLTGMSNWHAGMIGYSAKVASKYETEMPHALSAGGYHTVGIGKMHWWPQRNSHGFDTLILDESGRVETDGFISDYRSWFASVAPNLNPDATGIGWNDHTARVYALADTLHPTYWTANEALREINKHDTDKLLFIKVSFARPHSPYDPPQRYLDMYKNADIPATWIGEWSETYADTGSKNDDAAFGDFGADHAINSRRHYYASTTFIDDQVGRIIAELKARGMYDNSLIIFTSDHGDMMGDHHHWRKTYPHEGSSHIPFIVKLPDTTAGGVKTAGGVTIDKCVGLQDILPTFLDAAGVAIPQSIDGASLIPLINDNPKWRQYILFEHSSCYAPKSGWVALTDGKTKYIWYYNSGTEIMFDLTADPHELHNIAATDPAKATKWRGRMATELKERGAQWVENGKLKIVSSESPLNKNYPVSK